MFDSKLIHQALVKSEPCFGGGPWMNRFIHGLDADQAIPDGCIGGHEISVLGGHCNDAGLVNAVRGL